MVDLTTSGVNLTVAEAVNDHGQVVGASSVTEGDSVAFLWTVAGGMSHLGKLGGRYSHAYDVNEKGQVVGYSDVVGDLVRHATLWNTRTYNFRFVGIKQPPAFNDVVAGRAVAVSFSLGGNFGLAIFDDGSPTFERIACGASASVAPIAPTGGPPSGSLIYKPQVDRYAWATKTDRSWAGTCRSLTLRLNDGSSHVVHFAFK
jgi:probable HAF family extracellular repeat protein